MKRVSQIEGRTVSGRVLADLLMISPRRVQQLAVEGVFIRVGHNEYDLSPSVRNFIALVDVRLEKENEPSPASRLADRKAQRIEMAIAREERELIHVDDADAALAEASGIILDQVEAIGREVARDIGRNRDDRARILAIIEEGRVRLEKKFETVRDRIRSADDAPA